MVSFSSQQKHENNGVFERPLRDLIDAYTKLLLGTQSWGFSFYLFIEIFRLNKAIFKNVGYLLNFCIKLLLGNQSRRFAGAFRKSCLYFYVILHLKRILNNAKPRFSIHYEKSPRAHNLVTKRMRRFIQLVDSILFDIIAAKQVNSETEMRLLFAKQETIDYLKSVPESKGLKVIDLASIISVIINLAAIIVIPLVPIVLEMFHLPKTYLWFTFSFPYFPYSQ